MNSSDLVREALKPAFALWESIDTPRSLACSMLAKHGEWDQLVSLTVDPVWYRTATAYFLDAQATALLSKCGGLPTTVDLRAAAVAAFYDAERQCYRSNERLAPLLFGDYTDQPSGVREIVSLARKYLARVLGPCPDVVEGRFGPGATFGDRGQLTTVPDKMSSCPTLTPGSFAFLFQWSANSWGRAVSARSRSRPSFVRGNRFTTVPKDSKKDRGIAIEPSVNLFYQLGYGRVIRDRLRRNGGIDLEKGQDIHGLVVREASSRGHMATIDLSSASDTVCSALVELLLPPSWFNQLRDLRSPFTQVDGRWVRLEKFSSMGNGFTFELETVIFLSLCHATMAFRGFPPCEWENLFVYGDDIIVPSDVATDVIAVLRFFGFTPNRKKSFSVGCFRESCGVDCFLGARVRPFYLKEIPHEPQQYIAWANGLRRSFRDHFDGHGVGDGLYRRAWFRILDAIPSVVRGCRGPESLGDLVIHDERERWVIRTRHSIRYVRVYRPARYRRVPWFHWTPDIVLAAALYGVGDERGGERPPQGVTPRNAVAGYKVGWTVILT